MFVLIAGGGQIGLLAALTLFCCGIRCSRNKKFIIVEQKG
jgi:hypothetical protein